MIPSNSLYFSVPNDPEFSVAYLLENSANSSQFLILFNNKFISSFFSISSNLYNETSPQSNIRLRINS